MLSEARELIDDANAALRQGRAALLLGQHDEAQRWLDLAKRFQAEAGELLRRPEGAG